MLLLVLYTPLSVCGIKGPVPLPPRCASCTRQMIFQSAALASPFHDSMLLKHPAGVAANGEMPPNKQRRKQAADGGRNKSSLRKERRAIIAVCPSIGHTYPNTPSPIPIRSRQPFLDAAKKRFKTEERKKKRIYCRNPRAAKKTRKNGPRIYLVYRVICLGVVGESVYA